MDHKKSHRILPKKDWKQHFYQLVHFLWDWSEESWMVSWLCNVCCVFSTTGAIPTETNTLIVLANQHKWNDILIVPNRTVASLSTSLITDMCSKNVDVSRLWQEGRDQSSHINFTCHIMVKNRSGWRWAGVPAAFHRNKPQLWETNLLASFCQSRTEGSERSSCRSETCWSFTYNLTVFWSHTTAMRIRREDTDFHLKGLVKEPTTVSNCIHINQREEKPVFIKWQLKLLAWLFFHCRKIH